MSPPEIKIRNWNENCALQSPAWQHCCHPLNDTKFLFQYSAGTFGVAECQWCYAHTGMQVENVPEKRWLQKIAHPCHVKREPSHPLNCPADAYKTICLYFAERYAKSTAPYLDPWWVPIFVLLGGLLNGNLVPIKEQFKAMPGALKLRWEPLMFFTTKSQARWRALDNITLWVMSTFAALSIEFVGRTGMVHPASPKPVCSHSSPPHSYQFKTSYPIECHWPESLFSSVVQQKKNSLSRNKILCCLAQTNIWVPKGKKRNLKHEI